MKHVYFVAKARDSNETMELPGVEEANIQCARAHFPAISCGSVVHDVAGDSGALSNPVSWLCPA